MRNRRPESTNILFAPEALARLVAGFDHLAAVMAVTLGPTQGPILSSRSRGSVELLSDAGTIARRIVEVPDRGWNAGAMILRHLAWRMHEQYGDGAATAAVLARAMVCEGFKRIAAGVDSASIRCGLEQALPAALAALAAQAAPVAGQELLDGAATAITGDPELGPVLGEIVDLLGADVAITIEEFPVPFLDREYIAGAAWRAHPAARAMIPEGRQEIVLEQPLLMLVDQRLSAVDDVLPALEIAAQAKDRRPLLIVPLKMCDHALATIMANHAQGTVTAIASLLGATGHELTDALDDLNALTGGTVLADVLGRPPRRVRREDLGSARKAVVAPDSLTIVGGAGDPEAVTERSAALRRRMGSLTPGTEEWKRLQARVARLGGGSAILKLGAHSGPELTHKRAQAEKALRVLTGMLAHGAVPGGGVAYLTCEPAVRAVRLSCADADQGHGIDVLLTALAAPFMQIVHNHGLVHPPFAREEVRRLGCGHGLDVVGGNYVDMRKQGIVDSLRVTQAALELATSTAISVLTTGVVVRPAAATLEHRVRP
ncbi:MAG: TCP-1/cpn60 chaperonin family protein [Thermomicrobiales bacterium]